MQQIKADHAKKGARREDAKANAVTPPMPPRKIKLTMRQQEDEGKLAIHPSDYRAYYLICYQVRFDEPEKSEWPRLIKQIQSEVGGEATTIRNVFENARTGKFVQGNKKGAGPPRKLAKDNVGLLTAAMAINVGVPVTLAASICNATNKRAGMDTTICRQTLIDTLKTYTDVQLCAIQHRKTGSKDAESAWAKARVLFCSQMQLQYFLGKQIDAGIVIHPHVAAFLEIQPL